MKRYKTPAPRKLLVFILSVFLPLWLTGCLGDDSSSSNVTEDYIQAISTQSHGPVLADEEGNVLYFFTPDIKGESKCEGPCADSWPPFNTSQLRGGTGLDPADFDTITRSDGSSQTTYKGWPLYYFANDAQPGEINGDGANNNLWFVAKPDYSLMVADEQLVGADGNNYKVDNNGDYVQGDSTTTFFTDSEGRTLYIFTNDSADTNNCTSEGCMNAWPVFHVDMEALPSNMNPDDFGEITAPNSQPQLTYRGWPLYYFAQDAAPGETKGVSVPNPGVWPIVNTNTSEAPQ